VASTALSPRKRLKPDERRAVILAEAGQVLLEEGIGALTLRHVAQRLGIAPGLVNHYFPEIEALAAEAFTMVAEGEVIALFDCVAVGADPVTCVAQLVAALLQDDRRRVSLLWLDAWQASRNRTGLRRAVIAAMDLWQDRLSTLIAEGQRAGAWRVAAPAAAATRILALVDGLSIQAVTSDPDEAEDPARAILRAMMIAGVERELGVTLGKCGALS
jgi:AcrR family transcriptional regulator